VLSWSVCFTPSASLSYTELEEANQALGDQVDLYAGDADDAERQRALDQACENVKK
jgi:hypothetical protein